MLIVTCFAKYSQIILKHINTQIQEKFQQEQKIMSKEQCMLYIKLERSTNDAYL